MTTKLVKETIERTINEVQEECADLISSNPDINGSIYSYGNNKWTKPTYEKPKGEQIKER